MNIEQHIRKMTHFDLEPVMAIENESYEFPWSKGIMNDCFNSNYHCFVYELNNEIRGYIIFSSVLDEVSLLNICIAPEYQHNGYGKGLLNWLVSYIKNNDMKTLYLEVRSSNKVAVNLYESMGFNEIGIRENYYPAKKGKEDALLFAGEVEFL